MSKSSKSTEKSSPVKNNKEDMLTEIIRQKDRRILKLSNDVKNLTASEKKLSLELQRLRKIAPHAYLPQGDTLMENTQDNNDVQYFPEGENEKLKERSFSDHFTDLKSITDINTLKATIKNQHAELEESRKYIIHCHSLIEKFLKERSASAFNKVKEEENKMLKKKMAVAEKNITECTYVLENLKNTVNCLEERNVELECEVTQMKKADASSQIIQPSDHLICYKKANEKLEEKVKQLEEWNEMLQLQLSSEIINSKAMNQKEILFKAKEAACENRIKTMKEEIDFLQKHRVSPAESSCPPQKEKKQSVSFFIGL